MLAVCCPVLPLQSGWRLQVGQHLALPPPCSSWAKLPCPAASDCSGVGGRGPATGPAGGGRPLGGAAELLCGYFSQCLLYTMHTHDPSWRRELAGVEAPRGLPGHIGLDLSRVDVGEDGGRSRGARGLLQRLHNLCRLGCRGALSNGPSSLFQAFVRRSAQPGVPRGLLNTCSTCGPSLPPCRVLCPLPGL